MAVVMLSPTRALVDVFVGAQENPTRKPLRVRKRLANTTEVEAHRVEADIARALRVDGKWTRADGDARETLPATPTALRTLRSALELAYNDVEEGWRDQRNGVASFQRARAAIKIIGIETPCREVDRKAYAKVRETLERDGRSKATVRHYLQALHRVLYFAERERWITARPTWTRQPIFNARMFTFSTELEREALAYFQAIQQNDMADLITLGVECGFRLGELLSLEGKRVDLKSGLVLVPNTLSKTASWRQVVLTSRAREVLSRRVSAWEHGLLFPGWYHRKVSDMMHQLREHLGLEDNKECVFHATRHTCGSRMAAKGVPLAIIMEQLGHKNPQMTMRYVHMSALERRRVLVEKMEAE
jgi:integrase